MAKKNNSGNKVKAQGEVFTPRWLVDQILDKVGYKGKTILKKKIMENSFGQGVFLDAIIERYTEAGKEAGMDHFQIISDLSDYIYGIELEPANFQIVAKKYPFLKNITNSDTLFTTYEFKFDYIVGNFPYVRVHNLKDDYKSKIEPVYTTLFGTYDLYYAFYEWSINHLSDDGVIGVITPNSFLINTSAVKLRDMIEAKNIWDDYEDLSDQNIFGDDIQTYVGVFVLRSSGKIPPWKKTKSKNYNLSSFTKVQSGLATNADPIFIQPKGTFSKEIVSEGLVKDAFKCSSQTINEIIWPYLNGKLIDETIMAASYPHTYAYLLSKKTELLDRSLKGVKWYGYARSQGIRDMLQKKVAVSLLNPEGKFIYKELSADVIVYQGVYFTKNLKRVKATLKDPSFIKAVQDLGVKRQSGYNQITAGVFKKV